MPLDIRQVFFGFKEELFGYQKLQSNVFRNTSCFGSLKSISDNTFRISFRISEKLFEFVTKLRLTIPINIPVTGSNNDTTYVRPTGTESTVHSVTSDKSHVENNEQECRRPESGPRGATSGPKRASESRICIML